MARKQPPKVPATVSHKISRPALSPPNPNSLVAWVSLYFKTVVTGGSECTAQAKRRDLQKFLSFFTDQNGKGPGVESVDAWTPSVTKAFQKEIAKDYKATSVNRVMATLRHFVRWLNRDDRHELIAGDPFEGVKDIAVDNPDWNGLSDRQIMRLKSACEQRLKALTRADQNPLLEAAVFFTLLNTGLREFELCALDVRQYHHRGFHDVQRKGSKVSDKVPVPLEARERVEAYLKRRDDSGKEEPLFTSRFGERLAPREVQRICARLSEHASAHLPESEKFRLKPHQLRHTFLKRVADKFGVHTAQEYSGNISIREIYRYTRPSQEEMDSKAEAVFD